MDYLKLSDLYPYLSWDCPLNDNDYASLLARIIISYVGKEQIILTSVGYHCHRLQQRLRSKEHAIFCYTSCCMSTNGSFYLIEDPYSHEFNRGGLHRNQWGDEYKYQFSLQNLKYISSDDINREQNYYVSKYDRMVISPKYLTTMQNKQQLLLKRQQYEYRIRNGCRSGYNAYHFYDSEDINCIQFMCVVEFPDYSTTITNNIDIRQTPDEQETKQQTDKIKKKKKDVIVEKKDQNTNINLIKGKTRSEKTYNAFLESTTRREEYRNKMKKRKIQEKKADKDLDTDKERKKDVDGGDDGKFGDVARDFGWKEPIYPQANTAFIFVLENNEINIYINSKTNVNMIGRNIYTNTRFNSSVDVQPNFVLKYGTSHNILDIWQRLGCVYIVVKQTLLEMIRIQLIQLRFVQKFKNKKMKRQKQNVSNNSNINDCDYKLKQTMLLNLVFDTSSSYLSKFEMMKAKQMAKYTYTERMENSNDDEDVVTTVKLKGVNVTDTDGKDDSKSDKDNNTYNDEMKSQDKNISTSNSNSKSIPQSQLREEMKTAEQLNKYVDQRAVPQIGKNCSFYDEKSETLMTVRNNNLSSNGMMAKGMTISFITKKRTNLKHKNSKVKSKHKSIKQLREEMKKKDLENWNQTKVDKVQEQTNLEKISMGLSNINTNNTLKSEKLESKIGLIQSVTDEVATPRQNNVNDMKNDNGDSSININIDINIDVNDVKDNYNNENDLSEQLDQVKTEKEKEREKENEVSKRWSAARKAYGHGFGDIPSEARMNDLEFDSLFLKLLFRSSKCYFVFFHKDSKALILMLKIVDKSKSKSNKNAKKMKKNNGGDLNLDSNNIDSKERFSKWKEKLVEYNNGRLLLQLKIDFVNKKLLSARIGNIIINESKCRIIAYDETRSMVVYDTLPTPEDQFKPLDYSEYQVNIDEKESAKERAKVSQDLEKEAILQTSIELNGGVEVDYSQVQTVIKIDNRSRPSNTRFEARIHNYKMMRLNDLIDKWIDLHHV